MAGVHKSTVDKVIHNRPGVSEAKRAEIRQLLREYEYESNPLAKALNYQKKKMKVAVVLPEVDAMPFLKQGMEIVRQDFNSFNIEVVYYTMPFSDAPAQAKILNDLSKDSVSGVVLLPIEHPEVKEAIRHLEEVKIPVVLVNSEMSDVPSLCYVGQNMDRAGEIAARMIRLLMPQEAKIGIVASDYMYSVREREQSFRKYMEEKNHRIHIADSVLTEETPEAAYANTKALLQNNPDIQGLYITCGCVTDIYQAVEDSGRAEEMTILCFERYPAIAELVRNGKIDCTISADLEGQGRLAMRVLFEYLIYDRKPESEKIIKENEIYLKENI